jgi:hypothetical protein
MAIDSFDVDALDNYYRQNEKKIWVQGLVPAEAYQHMTVHTDVRDEEILTNLEIGETVQGWRKDFDPPTGADVFSQRTLKVRPLKTDRTYVPQQLRKEWLAQLQKPGFSEANLPFEAFIIQKLMEAIKESLELNAIFHGVSTWPTRPTTAAGSYDGFKTIIAAEILASTLTPVVTGAITVSNAIDAVEEVYDNADARLQSVPSKMYMSYPVYQLYCRAYRDAYGGNTNNKEFEKRFVDGSGNLCELVPLRAWGSSQRLVLTVQENMIIGIDSESDFTNMKMEMNKRNLDMWADYQQGVQIRSVSDSTMVVNDQV